MKTIDFAGIWNLNVLSGPEEAMALPSDIPIRIPGDIATALLEAGHMEDPFFGRNELKTLWIGKTDWSLSRTFTPEKPFLSQKDIPWFEFEKIDTVADILLNGQSLGRSENMFHRITLPAGNLKDGENRLEIRILSPEKYTAEEAAKQTYPVPHSFQLPWQWEHRNMLRKTACHGGWDWGITLMTGGIYGKALLHDGAKGHIEYLRTSQEKLDKDSWKLSVICEYTSPRKERLSLKSTIDGIEEEQAFDVIKGTQELAFTRTIRNPRLWWPAGQGEAVLYDLKVKLGGCEATNKIGFRTVEVISREDEVGLSMSFRVNGRDIFAKGANWIPSDAFPSRQTRKKHRQLLEDARSAHMNMIRVWGGGQYEDDSFYELCDELGIMIWHDMMFSCSLYPAGEEFLENVRKEIRHQIKRLVNHPSIVLWCGNNENLGALTWFNESRENRDRYLVDYDRLNEGVVGKTVKELDPGRTWWSSSPSAGEGDYSDCWHDDTKGDMHYWSVWHEGLPFEAYYDVIPRFCSEFGFQSFPGLKSVSQYAPREEWNITSPVMRHHQKNNGGNTIILSTMARYFRMPESFEDYLYLSQVQQAFAIRTAVDYWRAMRPVSMGALYWQLNDLWPVASWASIEYNGNWKLLHYEARRFFAPLALSLYKKDNKLHVAGLNDTDRERTGRLLIRLMDFEGSVLKEIDLGDQSCPADSALEFYSTDLEDLAGPTLYHPSRGMKPYKEGQEFDMIHDGLCDRFIVARWEIEGEVCTRSLLLSLPKNCDLGNPVIKVSKGKGSHEVIVDTDRPAFFVLPQTDLDGRFDDSGFTLIPGVSKVLTFLPASPSKGDLLDNLTFKTLG